MASGIYHRVSEGDNGAPVKITENPSMASLHYYDDDDEGEASDQDSLLEKGGPPSPGRAERGDIGGRSPRPASPRRTVSGSNGPVHICTLTNINYSVRKI